MFQKIIYLIFLLLFMSAMAVILWISDLFLSVWDKLIQQPTWFFWAYILIFAIFIFFSLFILYRILPESFLIKQKNKSTKKITENIKDINIKQIESRIELLQEKDIDIVSIRKEIGELKNVRQKKDIKIVLFGDISSGKSSLINALIPAAKAEVSVTGGTTRKVKNYQWTSPLGERLILCDTPGFDEQGRLLDELSRETVYKSHLGIYLCEGDLTASQYNQIKEVALLGKPLIIAFNKTDRFLNEDVKIISSHLQQRLDEIDRQIKLIQIQTGGSKEVTIFYPDGSEKTQSRILKADLTELLKAVSKILAQTSPTKLESIRQQAVLHLLSTNLDRAEYQYRQQQSHNIVTSSTKKAVIASMATITPGSDLLVQGYLAMAMIKDLCQLYEVQVKEMDIEKILKLLQSNSIGIYPLLLGIAGNGFKAFPGAGTLAGGFMHAVAYGLIFDSVGKAAAITLSTQGNLVPILVEDIYKEKLLENIESRTLELVKMVIKSKTDSKSG